MKSAHLSNRVLARAVVTASFLGLLGMSPGCSQSPSAPTPSAGLTAPPTTIALTGISLSASPSLVISGGELSLGWIAPGGRGCSGGGDWIAIYKVGDPDVTGASNGHSDLWYEHLCGGTSGTFTLNAPPQPGQYEFRYMVGDTSVARSNPVTVSN